MGRSIASFYTPDDGLEHAVQVVELAPGQNSGFPIMDVTFSPDCAMLATTRFGY